MDDILNANARAVLETLRASASHPTAQEVYDEVRQMRPRIGLATVYRILRQLAEQGVIKVWGMAASVRAAMPARIATTMLSVQSVERCSICQ